MFFTQDTAGDPPPGQIVLQPDSVDILGNIYWGVERIIDRDLRKGKLKY